MRQIMLFFLLIVYPSIAVGENDTQQFTPPDSILLEIALDKSTYLHVEPVFLDLFLVNKTDHTLQVVIPDFLMNHVKFIIVDTSGNRRDETLRTLSYTSQRTDILEPEDSVYRWYGLHASYGDPILAGHRLRSLPVGSYTVQALFLNKHYSNIEKFSVVEPRGPEKEAYDLLCDINRSMGPGKMQHAISTIEMLLELYPQSVYAPEALRMLASAYRMRGSKDDAKSVEASRRLLSQYPNSYRCVSAAHNIGRRIVLEERKELWREIIASRAGTRLARFARIWLENAVDVEVIER